MEAETVLNLEHLIQKRHQSILENIDLKKWD